MPQVDVKTKDTCASGFQALARQVNFRSMLILVIRIRPKFI